MTTRESFKNMTVEQAQSILKELTELESPKFMAFSIVFALFKTYGIPTVSSLLVSTGELSSQEAASKRIADTGVLLLEFAFNKPSSPRASQAIARMNFLHARYQRAGKILNSDMLYTLGVFALEPGRWINQYEWRKLTDFERCASGTFWKATGDAMEIDMSVLPSHASGWRDGLHWLEEVEAWTLEYEEHHMVPDEENAKLANTHLDVIFFNLPRSLRAVARSYVSIIVGERLRKAMLLPQPSVLQCKVFRAVLLIRRFFLRHASLPRPEFLRKDYIAHQPEGGTDRYNLKEYLSFPWYVKPTLERRWGPRAWLLRLIGRKLPGDDNDMYAPEGYLIEEVGPASQRGKGVDHMENTKLRLRGRGDCPFLTDRESWAGVM
ncbi:MAG: hypothetical protein Q9157_000962 [Trypethelium eluteriae]